MGDVQVPKAAASMRHSNVAVPSVSENVKLAVAEATVTVGTVSMVGTGGATVSTVHDRETAEDVLPAASFARTSKACEPWPRLVNCFGETQVAKAAASTRHSNVAPASVSENVKLAVVEAMVPVGPMSIAGMGGATVSTVQAREATAEVLFRTSLARTSKVCAPWPRLVNCVGEVRQRERPSFGAQRPVLPSVKVALFDAEHTWSRVDRQDSQRWGCPRSRATKTTCCRARPWPVRRRCALPGRGS